MFDMTPAERARSTAPTALERAAGAVSTLLALGGGFLPGIAPPQSGSYWLGVATLTMIVGHLLLELLSRVRSTFRSLTTARVKAAVFFGMAFVVAACIYFTLRFVLDYYIPLGGIVGLRGLWHTSEARLQHTASLEELWDWADGDPLKIWPVAALATSHLIVGLSFMSCLLTIAMAIFPIAMIIAETARAALPGRARPRLSRHRESGAEGGPTRRNDGGGAQAPSERRRRRKA